MNAFRDWLSQNRKEVILFILFFLISSISFALGYLSAREFTPPAIVIEKSEIP